MKEYNEEVLEQAKKYGYTNLFAILDRDEVNSRKEYAEHVNDKLGYQVALMLEQNLNAIDQALVDLESEQ